MKNLIILILLSFALNSCKKNGCTHSESFNYDPDAKVEDGSCIPKVFGCLDSTSINFTPTANTDDGSCIPKVYGCTNPNAVNYNSNANTDDGSCICNRDMFFGTYNVNSICSGVYHNGIDTTDFEMVIYLDSTNGCKVVISNIFNSGNTSSYFVSGNNILYPTYTYQWSGVIHSSGATLNLIGDSLFIYTYSSDNMAGLLNHCNMIGIKQ